MQQNFGNKKNSQGNVFVNKSQKPSINTDMQLNTYTYAHT